MVQRSSTSRPERSLTMCCHPAAAAASTAQSAQGSIHLRALDLAQQLSRPPALAPHSMLGVPAAGLPAGLEVQQQRRASAGHSTVTDGASAHQHTSSQARTAAMQDRAGPGLDLSTHTSQHQGPFTGAYDAADDEVPAPCRHGTPWMLLTEAAAGGRSAPNPAHAAGSISASSSRSLLPMSPWRQLHSVQPLQLAGVTARLSQPSTPAGRNSLSPGLPRAAQRVPGAPLRRSHWSARPQGVIPEPAITGIYAAGTSSTAPAAASPAALEASPLDSQELRTLRPQFGPFVTPLELLAAHEQRIVQAMANPPPHPHTHSYEGWISWQLMYDRLEVSLEACRQAIAVLQQHEQSLTAAGNGIMAAAAAAAIAAVHQFGAEAGPSRYTDGSSGRHLQDNSTQTAAPTSSPSPVTSQARSAGSLDGQPGQSAGLPAQVPPAVPGRVRRMMAAAQQAAARQAAAEAAEQQQQLGAPGAAVGAVHAGEVSRSAAPDSVTADLVSLMAR
jgi:hypothetical protein